MKKTPVEFHYLTELRGIWMLFFTYAHGICTFIRSRKSPSDFLLLMNAGLAPYDKKVITVAW